MKVVETLDRPDKNRADKIHREAIVIDMAASTNPAEPNPDHDGGDHIDRLLKGGVTAANVTICGMADDFRTAVQKVNRIRRLISAREDQTLLVETADDIVRAKREGKVGVSIFFQTSGPIEHDQLYLLPALRILGLRIMQLAYNERNIIGGGCRERVDDGLTHYGEVVVKSMNAHGIIIDGSHVGERTVREAAQISRQPIVYSHSNAYSLFPNPRNAHDDTLRAVADTGGVVGTTIYDLMLQRTDNYKPASLEDVLDNIDYCVNLLGVEHVGIGTDINENIRAGKVDPDWKAVYQPTAQASFIPDFSWLSDFPNITYGLVRRGYSDAHIRAILGGNFLRVASEVWGVG